MFHIDGSGQKVVVTVVVDPNSREGQEIMREVGAVAEGRSLSMDEALMLVLTGNMGRGWR